MGEAKVRELSEIERRAALKAASARRPAGPSALDGFGRPLALKDLISVAEASPLNTFWRVMQITPATEPEYPGSVWVDIVSRTRVLMAANRPNPHVLLVLPADAPAPEAEEKPSGVILTDGDR